MDTFQFVRVRFCRLEFARRVFFRPNSTQKTERRLGGGGVRDGGR